MTLSCLRLNPVYSLKLGGGYSVYVLIFLQKPHDYCSYLDVPETTDPCNNTVEIIT